MPISDLVSKFKVKYPRWELYINELPSWIVQGNAWPKDRGFPVSVDELDTATYNKDGNIRITFEEENLDVIKIILKEWDNGVRNPITNTSRAPQEMTIKVTLIDVNDCEPNKSLILNYPRSCEYINPPLGFIANYNLS